jgi:hypothetical protein
MGWVVVLIIVAVLAGGACIAYLQLVNKVPPEIKGAFNMAKQRRGDYRSARKRHEKRLAAARKHLAYLEDPMGRRLGSAGGVTLFERWIITPQASGSLIGVKATATDESSISVSQRLTVTRMVAFGVFSLAAPKKTTKPQGSAYIIIEGPEVSGVGVINASSYNTTPGPDAFRFAAQVNNAAREVAANAPLLPQRIAEARKQVAAAETDQEVTKAKANYAKVVTALPETYRRKFRDAGVTTNPN